MLDDPYLLAEWTARKEHVLTLEMRQFWLTILFQVFILAWSVAYTRERRAAIVAELACLFLFCHALAINAKMVVVSAYLKQFERYLESVGHSAVLWETQALDRIVFVPGGVFTTTSGVTILILLIEAVWVGTSLVRRAVPIQTRYAVLLAGALLTAYAIYVVVLAPQASFAQVFPTPVRGGG